MCVIRDDSYIVSGSNDSELKVWNIRDRSDSDLEDKDRLSEQLTKLLLSEDEPDLTVSIFLAFKSFDSRLNSCTLARLENNIFFKFARNILLGR